ncbi:Protein RRP6-like 1 [Bienertia sinuspersici]
MRDHIGPYLPSKVLELDRNSLEFLLKYYCGVNANKEYQTSDWRIRPLPYKMVKYAREDTHYLLYIQDLMLKELLDSRDDFGNRLAKVFIKSYEVSVQMYEKSVFSNLTSYLHLHGLAEANLDAKQLGVVAILYGWRDKVARKEYESTGFVPMSYPTN